MASTYSERALFCVTRLGKQNLILGHTWLKEHNPEVDWRTGKVEMSRCSSQYCNGCRTEAREERRTLKREVASISACRSSSFPATVENVEEEDAPDDEPTTSDIPFDIEEEIAYGQLDSFPRHSMSKQPPLSVKGWQKASPETWKQNLPSTSKMWYRFGEGSAEVFGSGGGGTF
jgi:hypothetical protein